MKMISSAGACLKSASENSFPLGSGSRKSGAWVPSGSIVELTATMQRTCYVRRRLSNGKRRVGGDRAHPGTANGARTFLSAATFDEQDGSGTGRSALAFGARCGQECPSADLEVVSHGATDPRARIEEARRV